MITRMFFFFSLLLHLKASVNCCTLLHIHNTIHQAFALGLRYTIKLQFWLTKGKKKEKKKETFVLQKC